MHKDIIVQCPQCPGSVNISAHLRDLAASFDEDKLPQTLVTSIACDTCGEYTISLSWGS